MIFFALAWRRQGIERRMEEGRQEMLLELMKRGVSLPDDVLGRLEKNGKG